MKTEDVIRQGNIAKVRRLLDDVTSALEIVTDESILQDIPFKELEAIQNPLFSSRSAICNLLTRYGEGDVYSIDPPIARRDRSFEVRETY